jgi:hypothetical protein
MAVVAYNIIYCRTVISYQDHGNFEMVFFCQSYHSLLISNSCCIGLNLNGIKPCWSCKFLGTFAKLQKGTISFAMSVRPSLHPYFCMEQLSSHCKDFHQVWYLRIFQKSVKKIKVLLKSDKSNEYFTWRPMYIYDIACWIILRMRSVSDKDCRTNKNTHFMSSNFF